MKMVVFLIEKVPAALRGEISRWMIECKTGVFVGNLSGMVRDKLWDLICLKAGNGAAMMLHSAANEQGFKIHTFGDCSRRVRDFDGLSLVFVPIGPRT